MQFFMIWFIATNSRVSISLTSDLKAGEKTPEKQGIETTGASESSTRRNLKKSTVSKKKGAAKEKSGEGEAAVLKSSRPSKLIIKPGQHSKGGKKD